MAAEVLVAYAPRFNFTQEVAEAVAETLRREGVPADTQPLKAVETLESYRAVVLGAPLEMSRWHKEALSFLGRHGPALSQRAVAVFAVAPLPDEDADHAVRLELDREIAKFPWLAPVTVEVFGAASLGLHWKVIPALKNMSEGGIEDWAAIESWADALPEKLGLIQE
jgi:menaquinone-dependent protoporphyrinogen oxidase